MKREKNVETKQERIKKWILDKMKEIGLLKLVLLLFAGILLLLTTIPSESIEKSETGDHTTIVTKTNEQKIFKEEMERQLSLALEQVQGIGKTKIMITLKATKELIINKDRPMKEEENKEKDSTGGERIQSSKEMEETTILVSDDSGTQTPYVIKELEPEIAGIVVVAQGGDEERIIKEITDACEVLFSLPIHKIKVMKMKEQ